MKCLFCQREITNYRLSSLLFKEDELCPDCRKAMGFHHQIYKLDGLSVESFYDYDSAFRTYLLQYKECYDEALKGIFLYGLEEYIRLRYWNYKIVFMPSTRQKIAERGFDHLSLLFENIDLPKIKSLVYKNELIQAGKSYKERKLMEDNFIYEGDHLKNVLIVDDVLTTGSSVLGAYRALRPFVNKTRVLVLASVRKK